MATTYTYQAKDKSPLEIARARQAKERATPAPALPTGTQPDFINRLITDYNTRGIPIVGIGANYVTTKGVDEQLSRNVMSQAISGTEKYPSNVIPFNLQPPVKTSAGGIPITEYANQPSIPSIRPTVEPLAPTTPTITMPDVIEKIVGGGEIGEAISTTVPTIEPTPITPTTPTAVIPTTPTDVIQDIVSGGQEGQVIERTEYNYADQLNNIISQITGQNFAYDPNEDSALKQAQDYAARAVLEEMNARGLLTSSMTQDRLAQMMNELIPRYEELAYNRFQDQRANLYKLADLYGNLDAVQYSRELDDRQFNLDAEIRGYETRRDEINDMWDNVNTLGYVDNLASQILGLPVGTPSADARVAKMNLDNQIALDKSRLDAENAEIKKDEMTARQIVSEEILRKFSLTELGDSDAAFTIISAFRTDSSMVPAILESLNIDPNSIDLAGIEMAAQSITDKQFASLMGELPGLYSELANMAERNEDYYTNLLNDIGPALAGAKNPITYLTNLLTTNKIDTDEYNNLKDLAEHLAKAPLEYEALISKSRVKIKDEEITARQVTSEEILREFALTEFGDSEDAFVIINALRTDSPMVPHILKAFNIEPSSINLVGIEAAAQSITEEQFASLMEELPGLYSEIAGRPERDDEYYADLSNTFGPRLAAAENPITYLTNLYRTRAIDTDEHEHLQDLAEYLAKTPVEFEVLQKKAERAGFTIDDYIRLLGME